MNYWWVNQTDNWEDEFQNGYIYSGESTHRYRKSILDVSKGDLVVATHGTGENRKIYATGIIAADPKPEMVPIRSTRRVRNPKKKAAPYGWEVPIEYTELPAPVLWAPIRRTLQGRFVAKHFTEKAAGVQGYLFPIPPATAKKILRLINKDQPPRAVELKYVESADEIHQSLQNFASEATVY